MGKNLDRLKDAAILGLGATFALGVVGVILGWGIDAVWLILLYPKLVVGGFILFWIFGK